MDEWGAEARSAGAPRGLGAGERRRSPSPVLGVWGLCPQKNFQKINIEIAYFSAFLQAKNGLFCSGGNAGLDNRHYKMVQ